MAQVLDKEVLKNLSMEEMMGLDIDEVGELEEFTLLPRGFFAFNVAPAVFHSGEGDGKDYLEVELTVAAVVELKDPAQEAEIVVGESKLSQRFYGSFGIQRFRTMFACIADHYKEQGEKVTVMDLMEKIGGHQIQGEVTHRAQKLDKEQKAAGEQAKVYGELEAHSVIFVG